MMWFNSEPVPKESNLVTQVMVWTETRGRHFSGETTDIVKIDDRTFKEVSMKVHGQDLFIFISDHPLSKETIDLGIFISTLVAQHHISLESYLSDIDFGDEISNGQGTETIQKLDYTIQ